MAIKNSVFEIVTEMFAALLEFIGSGKEHLRIELMRSK